MKHLNKIISLLLVFVMALSLTGCQSAPETDDRLELAIYTTGSYLEGETKNPEYGNELEFIALLRSGHIDFWDRPATTYETRVNSFLSDNAGVLGEDFDSHPDKYPDVILAYTALGKYADRTSNADLLIGISFNSELLKGGYLNKIEALTALKSADYTLSEEGDVTEEELIEFALSLQVEDGSFQYAGMKESLIEVTANAVIALSLCEETTKIKEAIEEGSDYLTTHIRKDDSLKDLALTVVALNSANRDATDVEGNDLLTWVLDQEREDGSYNKEDPEEKDGNIEDTAYALMAISSQYRFENDMTSYFDMSDIAGGTHNKLSPEWQMYLQFMQVFLVVGIAFLAIMLVVSRIRIKKWRAAGIYNEKAGRMMTDEEIAKRDIEEAKLENLEENKTEE